MKQIIFNFAISMSCFPVYLLMHKAVNNVDTSLFLGAWWIGFCMACLINGIVCLFKEL